MYARRLLPLSLLVLAACEPSLPTRDASRVSSPVWSVGDSWTLASKTLRQQHMDEAATASWTDERLFTFTVNGQGTIDGIPAYRVVVADEEQGDNYFTLYFREADKGLLRVEEQPRNRRGGAKLVTMNLFGAESDALAFPVVTDEALLGLNVPAFERGEGVFTYRGVLEGVGGFGGVIEQSIDARDGGVVVTMAREDLVVTQTWNAGQPWFSTQDVGGRVASRLVSVERKTAGNAATSASDSAFEIETASEGADAPQAWPTSGEARFVPWAFPSAIPNPEGEATGVWAGHWWPMLPGGNNLYGDAGPMEKYDAYLLAKTGTNPGAKAWEVANHKTEDSKNSWWGHCNGLAAASILEDEPKTSGSAHGVTFSVGDKKGLYTEINNGGGADLFIGARNNSETDTTSAAFKDVHPYDFHRTLVQWIGINREPVVMDVNAGFQVWNYPVYKYRMTTSPHAEAGKLNVTTTIWKVNFASPNHVGVVSAQSTYTYWVSVDAQGNPISGRSEWTGSSVNDHPDFIWHPNGRGTPNPIKYPLVKEIAELGQGGAATDDHPNTASATGAADTLTAAGVAGSFEAAGDVDYFRFAAEPGHEYTILTFALGAGTDTFVHLHGADGTTELRTDDDGGVENLSSKLVFQPTAAGTYFVKVRHYSPSGIGTYKVSLATRVLTPNVDDHPNTAAATGAGDVLNAVGVAGSIEVAGDVDFFRFDAVAGTSYTLETFGLSATMDTYLHLVDASGAELKKDDDSGAQRYSSKIVWTAPAAGTYFVKVKHYSATKTGMYSLKIN